MVSLDFSAATGNVNHEALTYKLRSLGIGGSFANISHEFLVGRTQRVCVDGQYSQYSNFSNAISGFSQGNVLGPLLLWQGLKIKLTAYADDANCLTVVLWFQ